MKYTTDLFVVFDVKTKTKEINCNKKINIFFPNSINR